MSTVNLDGSVVMLAARLLFTASSLGSFSDFPQKYKKAT